MAATLLRPDAKGRVGIDSLSRQLTERFGGRRISAYAAEVTPAGDILLHPRVELPADEAEMIVLSNRDRDALVAALLNPPKPNARLRAAFRAHRKTVKSL